MTMSQAQGQSDGVQGRTERNTFDGDGGTVTVSFEDGSGPFVRFGGHTFVMLADDIRASSRIAADVIQDGRHVGTIRLVDETEREALMSFVGEVSEAT